MKRDDLGGFVLWGQKPIECYPDRREGTGHARSGMSVIFINRFLTAVGMTPRAWTIRSFLVGGNLRY